jgi:hypothetical protein
MLLLVVWNPALGIILAGAEDDLPLASSRTFDNDPWNADVSGASRFFGGEVVDGSIMVNTSDDYLDLYVIEVQGGRAVNVSLQLLDYNVTDPSEHNLQLLIGRGVDDDVLWVDDAWTEFRWEIVSYLAPETEDYYVAVLCNLTHDEQPNSRPTNYTLSASVANPFTMPKGKALWGERDREGSSSADAWLILTPGIEYNEEMLFKLQVSSTSDFDLFVYQLWPYEPWDLHLLNASTFHGGDNLEYVFVGGSEGNYYVKIDGVGGAGDFIIQSQSWGKSADTNNMREHAVEILDNEPVMGHVDQGKDRYDWISVHLEDGQEISNLRFHIEEGQWDIFRLTFYNIDGDFMEGRFNSQNGDWPHDENPTTPTINLENLMAFETGQYYILVTAIGPYRWDPWSPFEPATCTYSLEVTLPNEPPVRDSKIPKVVMDEDTLHFGPDLSDHFTDPDGDELTFSLGKEPDHLDVDVEKASGKVTITPDVDWFGTEVVTFRATDDGPGQKYVEGDVTVQVMPVNDPPRIVSGRNLVNMTMNEDQVSFTDALSTIFTDPDNDPANPVIYSISILRGEMTPETGVIPLPFYNATMDAFEIGPIDFMFGNVTFEVTADDNNGTLPEEMPRLTLNVTVVHDNHAPRMKGDVVSPLVIELVEGERNDTLWVYDLVEDNDTDYAGDELAFTFTNQLNVLAEVLPDGTLVFDTAGSEYYPGQNYQEDIVLKVEDSHGEKMCLNFTVKIEPLDDPPSFRTIIPSTPHVSIEEGQDIDFKVIVDDDDTPTSILNFTWFVGKIQQEGMFNSFFTYRTDHGSADGYNRTVRVVVTDGTTTIINDWDLEIVDVNRPPEQVTIRNPENASVFEQGKSINFVGQAIDKDGDELTYIWYDGALEIGRGTSFTTKTLKAGFHTVTLLVSDGENQVNVTVVFEVRRKEGDGRAVPGFNGMPLIGAMAVALFISMVRRRWYRG